MVSLWRREAGPRLDDLLRAGDLTGVLRLYPSLGREQALTARRALAKGGAALVPALRQALLAGEATLAEVLVQVGGEEAQAALLDALASDDPFIQGATLGALKGAGATETLQRAAGDPRPRARLAGLRALGESAQLDAALEDDDAEIRRLALMSGGRPGSAPLSQEALTALGARGDESALLSSLTRPEAQRSVLHGMLSRAPGGSEALHEALTRLATSSGEAPGVSDLAVAVLARDGVNLGGARLELALRRGEEAALWPIAHALADTDAATPLLAAFAERPSWSIAHALSRTPSDDALWGLIAALRQPRCRALAAEALALRRDHRAIVALRDALPLADRRPSGPNEPSEAERLAEIVRGLGG